MLLIFAAAFTLITSCSGNGMPSGIMPIDTMKYVMYDIIRAQELALMTNSKDTTAANQKTFDLYRQVFAIHKISKEDFLKSFHYYEANPDKIKTLYDSVSAFADRKRRDVYMKLR
jgi:hypothetical protein